MVCIRKGKGEGELGAGVTREVELIVLNSDKSYSLSLLW